MTTLFPAPVLRRRYPVEFKAGRMIRDEDSKWLRPDVRKGLIYMDQGDEQLMHFYWKDRKTNEVEEDLIVFPDETEFVRVNECTTGRVYLLNFKSSSQKLFFWMQDAKDDKDEENATKVNRLINDPQGGLAESRQNMPGAMGSPFRNIEDLGIDHESFLQMIQGHGAFGGLPSTTPANEPQTVAPTSSEPGSAALPPGNSGVTPEQLGNLRNILSRIQVPEGTRQLDVTLDDVLTPSAIGPLLSDPEIASALFPDLPPNLNRTPEELREVIQSPQFVQALQNLSVALQTGQLGPLLAQLGLDPSTGIGVEAFLRAIQEQVNRQRGEDTHNESTTDDQGDQMEED